MGGFMLHGVFPWIIDGTIYFQKLLQDHAKLLTWDKQMLTWCGKPCCFFFLKHHLVMKFTFQSFHFTWEQMHTAQCEAQQAGKYLDPPLVLVTAGCPAWGKSDIKVTERSFFSVSLSNTFRVFRVIHFNKTWNSFLHVTLDTGTSSRIIYCGNTKVRKYSSTSNRPYSYMSVIYTYIY